MSEEQLEQPQVTPGQLLKQAREELGFSSQNIADKVRLKNSLILDIEADNYDINISLTFLKGYLKLYAKQVGVAEETVIGAFDNLKTQKKEPAKLQSFSKRIANQAHDDKLMLVTYLIVAIVIALVVIWWFQQSSSVPVAKVMPSPAPVAASPALTEESQALSSDLLVDEQLVDSAEPSLLDEPLAGVPADRITTIELEPSSQEPLESDVYDVAPVDLVFTFSSDCWMKLTDATGEDIAYGTKVTGRVMPVTGMPPFSVILCAPEVVKIDYDGEAVDLSGFRVGNTAKFTLPFSE